MRIWDVRHLRVHDWLVCSSSALPHPCFTADGTSIYSISFVHGLTASPSLPRNFTLWARQRDLRRTWYKMSADPVSFAVRQCPFLHELADKHGEQYARCIAIRPTKPVDNAVRRPILEEQDNLLSTFSLFHGASGAVPLANFQGKCDRLGACPFSSQSRPVDSVENSLIPCPGQRQQLGLAQTPLPFASLSLSFGGGVSEASCITVTR